MRERTLTVPYTAKGVEMHRSVEVRELCEEESKFLAGIFEVGGGINMTVAPSYRRNGEKGMYYTPKGLIYYSDSNPEKIERLAGIYGGKAHPHPRENSWRWITYGYAASALLSQIEPYAPHRRDTIKAFTKVYEEPKPGMDERLCIANKLQEYTHMPKSYPDIDAYDQVKDDPYFLAGAFFGRGVDYTFEQDAPLRFWSQNPVVLAAIGQPYNLEPYAIMNEKWPRQPDARIPVSFRLEMNAADKADFLSKIQPGMLILS